MPIKEQLCYNCKFYAKLKYNGKKGEVGVCCNEYMRHDRFVKARGSCHRFEERNELV